MADSVCHALPIFFMALQTEILSTGTSNYLKQIIHVFLRSLNSVFLVVTISSWPDELLRERWNPK